MKSIAILLATLAWAPAANAAYTETMDPNGVTKNLQADFGLVDDNAGSNQSDRLQKAIDTVSTGGGGRLLIPRGTYRFAGITMKSNVHLLIEKPMTTTLEQADDLVALADSRRRVLQVGLLERFNPAVVALSEALENPLFIEPKRVQTDEAVPGLRVVLLLVVD